MLLRYLAPLLLLYFHSRSSNYNLVNALHPKRTVRIEDFVKEFLTSVKDDLKNKQFQYFRIPCHFDLTYFDRLFFHTIERYASGKNALLGDPTTIEPVGEMFVAQNGDTFLVNFTVHFNHLNLRFESFKVRGVFENFNGEASVCIPTNEVAVSILITNPHKTNCNFTVQNVNVLNLDNYRVEISNVPLRLARVLEPQVTKYFYEKTPMTILYANGGFLQWLPVQLPCGSYELPFITGELPTFSSSMEEYDD